MLSPLIGFIFALSKKIYYYNNIFFYNIFFVTLNKDNAHSDTKTRGIYNVCEVITLCFLVALQLIYKENVQISVIMITTFFHFSLF